MHFQAAILPYPRQTKNGWIVQFEFEDALWAQKSNYAISGLTEADIALLMIELHLTHDV